MVKFIALAIISASQAFVLTGNRSYAPKKIIATHVQPCARRHDGFSLFSAPNNESKAPTEISKAPNLNGKAILPVKAMVAGLKGHKVAAVYAVLNSGYKRG